MAKAAQEAIVAGCIDGVYQSSDSLGVAEVWEGEGSTDVKLGILTLEEANDLTVIRKRLEEGI